ncbi:MAG: hypothetical protein ACD_58C00177G0010 [uncultured bacterium]|nr:MAG: hypothetical protein ACD_58C00177G0010 [uncultured bacterium]
MFDKSQEATSGPGTIVGANVKLTGILKDANDITIFGHVEGEVISDKNVMLEENASIKGPITAQVITVSGSVNGSINAETKLEITPTGKVTGSITTRDLIIKSGAQFDGKSAMIKSKSDGSKTKVVEEVEDDLKGDEAQKDKKEEPKYEVE